MAWSAQGSRQRLRRRALVCAAVVLLIVGCRRGVPPSVPTASYVAPTSQKLTIPPSTATATATTDEPPETSAPTRAATPLPTVSGMTHDQVASLSTLVQIDDYPLYVMHAYGDAALASNRGAPRTGFACSLFAALGHPDRRLYGRNYDWDYSPALVLFAHPEDGYDSVSVVDIAFNGLEGTLGLTGLPIADRVILLDALGVPFDGMNAAGLAIGMAAVPSSDVPYDAALPDIGSLGIIREMLDHAGTVEEALEIMRGHNVHMAGGPHIHYLLADSGGDAALVEFYKGEMVVLDPVGAWHAATNHFRAPLDEGARQMCHRYAHLSEELVGAQGRVTVEEALGLLSDVSQSSTQWSAVYDMSSLALHIAMGHDYGDVTSLFLSLE